VSSVKDLLKFDWFESAMTSTTVSTTNSSKILSLLSDKSKLDPVKSVN